MALAVEGDQVGHLGEVARIIRESGRTEELLARFTEVFFSGSDEDELSHLPPDCLAALVISAWEFASVREPDELKLRTFNLDAEVTGGPDITVIEILNDDMPFLVDSVMGEILERGLSILLIIHPVFLTERKDGREILTVLGRADEGRDGLGRESYIQIHLERTGEAELEELKAALLEILIDVRTVVADWQPMVQRLKRAIAAYTETPPPVPVAELAESIQFLKWLVDDHFTFLGMRAQAFIGGIKRGRLEPVLESGLGILRDSEVRVLRRGRQMVSMTPEIRKFFLSPAPLIVTKANVRSKVHRRVHMDYIGIKIYSESGELSGELRIVGLFTSVAYTRSVKFIPFLRHKVELVMRRSGYAPDSHGGKALLNILENYPRDELFQIDANLLFDYAMAIQQLELRPRVRAFQRADEFDRFVSVLVYVPREGYSSEQRVRIGDFLAETFRGRISAYYPFFLEGPLVRIHFIIGRYKGVTPQRTQAFLEREITDLIRTWNDRLRQRLNETFTGREGERLRRKYRKAFPAAYKDSNPTERALEDIERIEQLTTEMPVAIDFYRRGRNPPNQVQVTLYHLYGPIPLSRRVPILENLGFAVIDERSYRIEPADMGEDASVSLHDMVLESQDGEPIDLQKHEERLEETFRRVWRNEVANDHYNRLVLKVGMTWWEAAVTRAYGRYLRQIRAPFGQSYLSGTLARHAGITEKLMELFRQRFDPDRPASHGKKNTSEQKLIKGIEAELEEIPSLEEDRIIRQFLNLVVNTLRTNVYLLVDGRMPPAIAFKFDSPRIENAPEPRPFVEIFVYTPDMEGIHLRGGRIARGGLRWSDRSQDFRTEVLSLAKAQQLKNAVIVPTGAKGGFVPKRLGELADREQIQAEGVAAYKLFVNTLLSITDNLQGNRVVPPKGVVRHDGDDPYLVVAADKGTAAFSDIANEISLARDFWLGDAFASGGSAGYDHKKMGITARGAWEAVKRHFREMDVDIQTTPFSVIGIGDMSGDVFGNGMLLSKQIKLLAAFDHRDIFVDPNPDPSASWRERKRIFNKARSSWHDYDKALISKGGGVFSRSAKAIGLSKEMKALTGLEKTTATPNELIRALLASEADLLWFGGIGTYVRGNDESDDDADDRANDAIRIKASQLRVKVIGEGANLGITQPGRVDFALAGGRINTDAIDNSAGVNSSDLEVNIKIALGQAIAAGELDQEARNALLAEMTNQVAEACLRNNYLQTLALSLAQRRGILEIGFQIRLMRDLERAGLLDREIESLPNDIEIAERQELNIPLTRPELAVLLGYAKIELYNELIRCKVPDDPYFDRELRSYFPPILREREPEYIDSHRLRREIIATQLANAIINRGGSTIFVRLKEETGRGVDAIALAFTLARAVFDLDPLYEEIDGLDNKIDGMAQLDLYLGVQDTLRRQTAWFLRHAPAERGLSGVIEHYREQMVVVAGELHRYLTEFQRRQLEADLAFYAEMNVPQGLGTRLAELRFLADGPDMILRASALKKPVPMIMTIYKDTASFFRIDELRAACNSLLLQDYFDRLAINSVSIALANAQGALVSEVVSLAKRGDPSFERWCESKIGDVERAKRGVNEILDGGELTLAKLTVAFTHLRDVVTEWAGAR